MWSQELDSVIFVDPFQVRILYDSVILDGVLNLSWKKLGQSFIAAFRGVSRGPSDWCCLRFSKLFPQERGMAWLNDRVILHFYGQSGWELLASFWSGRSMHLPPPFLRGICGAGLLAVWVRNAHPASI